MANIRIEEIPEEYRDIAETLGMDSFLKLIRLCGGQILYLPMMKTLEREGRDREIQSLFNGGNYRSLAIQFQLSERQIRKIIKKAQEPERGVKHE